MFAIHATEDVIAETLYRLRRNHPKADGSLVSSVHDRIVECLDGRVDDFTVDGSFAGEDGDDAHVHAAAVACGAGILLTADGGFRGADPTRSDELPYEIYHPDEFFILIDDSAPFLVRGIITEQLTYWYRSKGTVDLPGRLRKADCPEFADRVRVHLQTIDWTPPKSR